MKLGRRPSFKWQIQELIIRSSTFKLNRHPSKKTHLRTRGKILNFQIKQKPIQEDSLKNTGPKAQLQKTNPRTRGKRTNFQIQQKPIQEDSFKKKLGRRPSFKRQIQELVVRSSTFRLNRNPSEKTHWKKAGPKAQLQKTNPRTRCKILNFQIKQKPI